MLKSNNKTQISQKYHWKHSITAKQLIYRPPTPEDKRSPNNKHFLKVRFGVANRTLDRVYLDCN